MQTPTTRLAVLGFGHETNTFSTVAADLATYEADGIHRAAELVEHHGSAQSTYAGFLAPSGDDSVELVPLLSAWINPCGAITVEAFDAIVGEMVQRLRDAGRIDGVLLGLHGAAVADGHPDADAEIAARVRGVVGPEVPIGAVVDMHANLESRLLDQLDLLFAYQTNPHVDARERGIECRAAVLEVLRTGHRPGLALEQLPLVVTITRQDTREEPMAGLLAHARDLEAADGVVDVSVLEGFPYADVEHMGMSVLVTHRDGREAARAVARRMGERVWAAREPLQGGGVAVEDALAAVSRGTDDGKPLLLLDVGDNVGGGGPGDSTVVLEAAQRLGVGGIVVVLLDPGTVSELAGSPLGSRVAVSVGGRSAEHRGTAVPIEATVVGRSDGRYEEPKMAHGGLRFFDSGQMVALRTDEGITVVLTSKLVQPITPAQLRAVGLDPTEFRAVVAKGVNGPRVGYADVCGDFLVLDTPGVTRLTVEAFSYRHRRTPMFPFESGAGYPIG